MEIEFFFDTACPWSHIGKRRLDAAIRLRPHVGAQIFWRPFLLHPNFPSQGVDFQDYLKRKFPSQQNGAQVCERLKELGRAEGIPFAFDRIRVVPNTLFSHRLIRFAAQQGREEQAIEAVFEAYFQQGCNIGNPLELMCLAADIGLSAKDMERVWEKGEDALVILQEDARARRWCIEGVPCLVINGRYAIAGAQEVEVLLRLMDLCWNNPRLLVA